MPCKRALSRRSSRAYDVQTALDGIDRRQKATGTPGSPRLLHHVYAVERLEQAYLRSSARAPG